MKWLQRERVISQKHQAEVIAEENILWDKGFLRDRSPQSLLDTMVFYSGLCFVLCRGREHQQLRNCRCQIEVVGRPAERAFLKCTEDASKNNQGGLRGCNVTPKIVLHHASAEHPERCFVHLYKRYCALYPDTPHHAFYLQPSQTPTSSCRYTNKPLGHTTLGKTISRLCKAAGIDGFHTNHIFFVPLQPSDCIRQVSMSNLWWNTLGIAV